MQGIRHYFLKVTNYHYPLINYIINYFSIKVMNYSLLINFAIKISEKIMTLNSKDRLIFHLKSLLVVNTPWDELVWMFGSVRKFKIFRSWDRIKYKNHTFFMTQLKAKGNGDFSITNFFLESNELLVTLEQKNTVIIINNCVLPGLICPTEIWRPGTAQE